MKMGIKSFWPGAIGLVIATILFCIPGKEFPEEHWFAKIFLDKWIHVGLFASLVLLWSLPFIQRSYASAKIHRLFLWIALGFVTYGIAIEFIQGHFIPHRSFGVDDIIADGIGCGIGFLFARWQAKAQKN